RVAGHVLGNECLGSIDYAVGNLGESLKLLVVLGHSGCGAVTAAVDIFLDPARYLAVAGSHALRSIVDGLLVAVRTAGHALEGVRGGGGVRMPGCRQALIETAVALNAALTAGTLCHEFRGTDPARVQVVYGVYHLVSREVNLPVGMGSAGRSELFEPPGSEDDFGRLSLQLAGCEEVTHLLERT